MPAIWSSSERPISVRTVWVEGIRHAILSSDDPLINCKSQRSSRVSRNKSYSPDCQQLDSSLDRLNSCFTNLHVVVNNNLTETKALPQMHRKSSAPPRSSTDPSDSSAVDSLLRDNRKIQKKRHCYKTVKGGPDFFSDKRSFRNVNWERKSELESGLKLNMTECRQTDGTFDTFCNPLFERVLQWLDLSGRAQSNDFPGKSPRYEGQKWSPIKKRLSRLKHDSFEERHRITVKNYKLHKECNSDYSETEENKMSQRRLPKIKNTRKQFEEYDETSVDPLVCALNSARISLKPDEEELKDKIQQKISSTSWSPPGRLKLHVVIPSLVRKENQSSSQESLIN